VPPSTISALPSFPTRRSSDLIWKGLGVITAILAAVAGFSILTKGATAFLSGGGIILIAIGLMALVAPLQMLGSMDTGKLVKGLLAMAGAFAIIAATSSLMSTSILAGAGKIGRAHV